MRLTRPGGKIKKLKNSRRLLQGQDGYFFTRISQYCNNQYRNGYNQV